MNLRLEAFSISISWFCIKSCDASPGGELGRNVIGREGGGQPNQVTIQHFLSYIASLSDIVLSNQTPRIRDSSSDTCYGVSPRYGVTHVMVLTCVMMLSRVMVLSCVMMLARGVVLACVMVLSCVMVLTMLWY